MFWEKKLYLTVRFPKQIANSNSDFFFLHELLLKAAGIISDPSQRISFNFVKFRHKLAYKIRNFVSKIKPEIRGQVLTISLRNYLDSMKRISQNYNQYFTICFHFLSNKKMGN